MDKLEILEEIIKINKPITIEKYIELCLYSKNGYYKKSHIIGRRGDFITAPEVSQLFGEIIGLFILDDWQKNIKQPFNLIELGPGIGTLLLDILRITKSFKQFSKTMKIQLVETNSNLVKKQKINLSKNNVPITSVLWSEKFDPIDQKPVVILSNEFFDCFPIRQFYKKKNQWYEKMIQFNNSKKMLEFKDMQINALKTIKAISNNNTNDILEISKSREKYFSTVIKHIKKVGGIMILVDYGYFEKKTYFTLQSLYNNKKSYVLDNVGSQDITSHVDFKKLIYLVKLNNLKIKTFTTQRNFLIKNGIIQRTKKIIFNLNNEDRNKIKEGLNRLINNKEMGLFKVLVISK